MDSGITDKWSDVSWKRSLHATHSLVILFFAPIAVHDDWREKLTPSQAHNTLSQTL